MQKGLDQQLSCQASFRDGIRLPDRSVHLGHTHRSYDNCEGNLVQKKKKNIQYSKRIMESRDIH